MAVPYTFGTATAAIPLSQLDSNFATAITIGNTAVQLGNTVTTLNNMTLANVTISSGTITITNVAVTTANVSGTANISTLVVSANASVAGNVSVTGNTTVAGSVVLSGGTANGVAYLNTSKSLTTGSDLVFDGTNLGIGTNLPATKLHVLGAAQSAIFATSSASLNFTEYRYNTTTTNGYIGNGGILTPTGAVTDFVVRSEGALVLASGGATGRVYLDTSGNFGIGTTSPTSRLHVSNSSASTNAIAQFTNGTTGTGAGNGLYVGIDSTNTATIFNFYNSALQFGTNGTTKMTLDASGNLLIGTTSGSARLNVAGSAPYMYVTDTVGANKATFVAESTNTIVNVGSSYLGTSAVPLALIVGGAEKARIDTSGRLLVGCTATDSGAQFRFQYGSGQNGLQLFDNSGASGSTFVIFGINSGGNSNIGSIARVSATSAVVYNTTSDYRLKTVTGAVTGQGARIDALKPIDYQWTEGGQQARGFLAHEFAEVYANSVTGTKDAVDEDGKPKYQAMQASSSEVIADLVAEIQSLRKRLAAANL